MASIPRRANESKCLSRQSAIHGDEPRGGEALARKPGLLNTPGDWFASIVDESLARIRCGAPQEQLPLLTPGLYSPRVCGERGERSLGALAGDLEALQVPLRARRFTTRSRRCPGISLSAREC